MSPPDTIRFLASHRPPLPSGAYALGVTLLDRLGGGDTRLATRTARFTVAGERYSLRPADLRSCYPPPGATGEFTGVLPHLVFHRSTLPWERSPGAPSPTSPSWLALLAFRDEEAPRIAIVPARTLEAASASPWWPGHAPEPGQDPEERVTAIDVPAPLLAALAPTWDELGLVAHARISGPGATGEPADDAVGAALDGGDRSEVETEGGATEVAVVVGTRLLEATPGTAASGWVVHLVSLERCYAEGRLAAPAEGTVRLVSLHRWGFACAGEGGGFLTRCERLDGAGALCLPVPAGTPAAAARWLEAGSVPLPHHLRTGGRTVSWYRGPLVPALPRDTPIVDVPLPARCADDLLVLDRETGLLDVSYAAAWELGRTSALADRGFSTRLARWKRARAWSGARLRSEVEAETLGHLGRPHAPSGGLPDALARFLDELASLRSLPAAHLVPDARMLPPESLRFAEVDPVWVSCLLDGALSVGRVTGGDHARDALGHAQRAPRAPVSAVLLRSDLVAHYPALEVAGYSGRPDDVLAEDPGLPSLPAVTTCRLAEDVLLVVFAAGNLDVLDLRLPPEALHFGLDATADGWSRPVRHPGGPTTAYRVDAADLRDRGRGVLDLARLAGALGAGGDSGRLALELVLAAPCFRVTRGGP